MIITNGKRLTSNESFFSERSTENHILKSNQCLRAIKTAIYYVACMHIICMYVYGSYIPIIVRHPSNAIAGVQNISSVYSSIRVISYKWPIDKRWFFPNENESTKYCVEVYTTRLRAMF